MSRTDLNISDCIQGSEEWFNSRLGVLSSSRIADALRKAKRESTGELETRKNLRLELAVERITNKPAENFVSPWMARGTELEPMARAAYELRTDQTTEQVGFVYHPTIEWAGCSPDALLNGGLAEFKCPKTNTHAEYLLGEVVPSEYIPQMMWQMACCPGYEWCDFVSYHPDFPEPLDLFICRLPRDNKIIADMEVMAEAFLKEVADTVERIKSGLEGTLRKSLSTAANGAVLPSPKSEAAPL